MLILVDYKRSARRPMLLLSDVTTQMVAMQSTVGTVCEGHAPRAEPHIHKRGMGA